MKIYIASSWKNQHTVEMLTDVLRKKGHKVLSFIDEAAKNHDRENFKFDVEEWIMSDDGWRKFNYDTEGATQSDLVIYVGPSGTDAWAEVGAAWAGGTEIFGLHAKGEPSGLMRRMVVWFYDYRRLLEVVEQKNKRRG